MRITKEYICKKYLKDVTLQECINCFKAGKSSLTNFEKCANKNLLNKKTLEILKKNK